MVRPGRRSWVRWVWIFWGLVAAVVLALTLIDFDEEEIENTSQARIQGRRDVRSRIMQLKFAAMARAMSRIKVPTVRVSGDVTDSRGAPIPEARVFFIDGPMTRSAPTDSSDGYSITLPRGVYRSYARAESYSTTGSEHFVRHSGGRHKVSSGRPLVEMATVVSALENVEAIDFILAGTGTITGRVIDADGDPVSGASVVSWDPGTGLHSVRLVSGADSAVTGRDGGFTLEALVGHVNLDVYHPEYAGLRGGNMEAVFVVADTEREVDLTLVRGCRITGRVIDTHGDPADDGAMELSELDGSERYYPVGNFENGRFVLDYARGGTFGLKAWPWKSPPSEPLFLDCEEGVLIEDVEFVIPVVEPDMEGILLSSDGEPIAGGYVDISPLGPYGFGQQERTDSEGKWAVFSMPPGKYHISAYVPGEGVSFKVINSPSTENELVLSGLGDVSGTVNGIDDGSFSFEAITCIDELHGRIAFGQVAHAPRIRKKVSAKDGRFYIRDLPACTLEIQAFVTGKKERTVINVTGDGRTQISLDFRERDAVQEEAQEESQSLDSLFH